MMRGTERVEEKVSYRNSLTSKNNSVLAEDKNYEPVRGYFDDVGEHAEQRAGQPGQPAALHLAPSLHHQVD